MSGIVGFILNDIYFDFSGIKILVINVRNCVNWNMLIAH